jgi:hypothetical protein
MLIIVNFDYYKSFTYSQKKKKKKKKKREKSFTYYGEDHLKEVKFHILLN